MRVDLEEEEEIKQQRLEELVLSRSNSSFHLLQILLFRPSGKIEPATNQLSSFVLSKSSETKSTQTASFQSRQELCNSLYSELTGKFTGSQDDVSFDFASVRMSSSRI